MVRNGSLGTRATDPNPLGFALSCLSDPDPGI